MRFNFRKIASATASTLMMGSTIALAAAASYPAPFVQGGKADVGIVYGTSAASSDLVAATDIATNLQNALVDQGGSGGGTPTGDFVKLAKPSNNVNLGNRVTDVFGTTVTGDDLKVLLANGVYRNDKNDEYKFEQRITLGTGMVLEHFKESDYKDNTPSIGINLTNSQLVLNYTLDFVTEPDSTVTGGDLVDFENTDINFLGRSYFISDFDNSTLDITLLDSANTGFVAEGETVTVNVGGKTYQVMIEFISTDKTILVVNGERTNSMSEGETYKLSDGTYVGVKDILARDVSGTIGKVEFSLGSGKLELRAGNSIRLNDKTISQVTAEVVRGTASGGKEKLRRINIVWTTDDREFVTPESSLIMPGFENLKLSMDNFVRPAEEITRVEKGAADWIQVRTTIKGGEVSIPLLFTNSSNAGNFTGLGRDSSNKLATSGINDLIYNHTGGDRMFVASWNTSNTAESYLLRFEGFTQDEGKNKTTVQSYENGGWVDRCVDRDPQGTSTCSLGSLTLTVNRVEHNSNARWVNATYSAGGSFNHLYTAGGMKIFLPYVLATNSGDLGLPGTLNMTTSGLGTGPAGNNVDSWRLTMVERNKDDNVAQGTQFNATIDSNSDNELEVTTLAGFRTETNPDDSDHLTGYVYSDLATKVERFGRSSDQRYAVISYAGGESYADVFLSGVDSGSSSGSGALGSVTVLDSEVSKVSSNNLIVVGGSCINTVAASLLGSSSPVCGSSFTDRTGVASGEYLVQSFQSPFASAKIALLVAGYNGADTTNAAKYLTTQKPDTTVGNKWKGSNADSAQLV